MLLKHLLEGEWKGLRFELAAIITALSIVFAIHYALCVIILLHQYLFGEFFNVYLVVFIMQNIGGALFYVHDEWTMGRLSTILDVLKGIGIGIFTLTILPVVVCSADRQTREGATGTIIAFILYTIHIIMHSILYGYTQNIVDRKIILSIILSLVYFGIIIYPNIIDVINEILKEIPQKLQIIMVTQFLLYLCLWLYIGYFFAMFCSLTLCIMVVVMLNPFFILSNDIKDSVRSSYYEFIRNGVKTKEEMINKCYCVVNSVKDNKSDYQHFSKMYQFIALKHDQKLKVLLIDVDINKYSLINIFIERLLIYFYNEMEIILFGVLCLKIGISFWMELFVINIHCLVNIGILIVYICYIVFYVDWIYSFKQKIPSKLSFNLMKIIYCKFRNKSKSNLNFNTYKDLDHIYYSMKCAQMLLTRFHPDIALIITQYQFLYGKSKLHIQYT